MEQIKRARAPYRFDIPADLVPRLRELQSRQKPWSAAVDAEDVVHLYYGLGPALFLAFDGRIITDDYDNFTDGAGAHEVTDPKEAWAAVAVGAAVWGVPELNRLLPEKPASAPVCPHCEGVGWLWPTANRPKGSVVCSECGALGWLLPGAAPTP